MACGLIHRSACITILDIVLRSTLPMASAETLSQCFREYVSPNSPVKPGNVLLAHRLVALAELDDICLILPRQLDFWS